MYQDIYKNYSYRTIANEERFIEDDIFCQKDLPDRMTNNTLESDSSYKTPDKMQYIFSTMRFNTWVMYSNNLASPIRQKDRLTHNYNLFKKLGNDTQREGVIIVDYYRLNRIFGTGHGNIVENVTNYLINTKNVYPNNVEIINNVRDKLVYTKRHNAWRENIVLRVVTFIPKEYIEKYSLVYVPTADIVIGCCELDDSIVHPNSEQYIEHNKLIYSDVKNFIEIDIVDKNNDNYFTKLGNELVTLQTTKNPRRKEACYVNFYNDRTLVKTEIASIDEMGEKLGIYKSEAEANYNGDIANKLNEQKLNNELEKIRVEAAKITKESTQLQYEYDNLKAKYDLEHARMKHEKQMMNEKYAEKALSSYLEFVKKEKEIMHMSWKAKLDMEITKVKAEYDLKIAEAKTEQERLKIVADRQKFINDLKTSYAKSNNDKSKLAIDNVGKFLTLSTLVAKLCA